MIRGLRVGDPCRLLVDTLPTDFQYTGREADDGAEVMARIGFEKGQSRSLEFVPSVAAKTNLARFELPAGEGARIGVAPREIVLAAHGLFGGFAGFSLQSEIRCEVPLRQRRLFRVNDGPLFTDYSIEHKPDRLVWTNCLPNFQSDPDVRAAAPECGDPGASRRGALAAVRPQRPGAPTQRLLRRQRRVGGIDQLRALHAGVLRHYLSRTEEPLRD